MQLFICAGNGNYARNSQYQENKSFPFTCSPPFPFIKRGKSLICTRIGVCGGYVWAAKDVHNLFNSSEGPRDRLSKRAGGRNSKYASSLLRGREEGKGPLGKYRIRLRSSGGGGSAKRQTHAHISRSNERSPPSRFSLSLGYAICIQFAYLVRRRNMEGRRRRYSIEERRRRTLRDMTFALMPSAACCTA